MEQKYDSDLLCEETESFEDVNEEPKKRLFDPMISIVAVQVIVCAAAILICVIIKFCFKDAFSQMKDWYGKNVNVDTDINQVLNAAPSDKKANGKGGPYTSYSSNTETTVKGAFAIPVNGTVSSQFGYRIDPFTNKPATHNGIDIAAKSGENIYPAMKGQVKKVGLNNADYGNYIIIDHGGIETLYGHCKEIKAGVGQNVDTDTVIALCGSTGRSTGPHLHFEVRVNNVRIDPGPLLGLSVK